MEESSFLALKGKLGLDQWFFNFISRITIFRSLVSLLEIETIGPILKY